MTTTSQALGKVHSQTCRMSELAKTIMRLHPSSESRNKCITEYYELLNESKRDRDQIPTGEDRKTATWLIRTVSKPVDNCGNQITL